MARKIVTAGCRGKTHENRAQKWFESPHAGNLLAFYVCCVVGFIATQIPVYFFLVPMLGCSLVFLGFLVSRLFPEFS